MSKKTPTRPPPTEEGEAAGGHRPPSLRTAASGPGRDRQPAQAAGAQVCQRAGRGTGVGSPRCGCPSWTTSSSRWRTPTEADPIVDGVKAVRDQALDLLAALGFPRDDETGIPFDPGTRRSRVVPAVANRGTVVPVVRPGYGKAEQQLRPAAVVVAGEQQDS